MSSVNGVNANALSNLIEQINSQKSDLESKIGSAKADYNNDQLFNGANIGESGLTINQVQNMSWADISLLLATPSDAEINAKLEEAENKLGQYLQEFDKLTNEINTLQADLAKLQNELTQAQEEKVNAEKALIRAQNNKENAEEEVAEAQVAYEKAKRNQASAMSDAEDKAYEDAMKAFEEQEANGELKPEEKLSFNEFLMDYRKKAKCSSSFESAISDAASNLASKKALVRKYDNQINTQNDIISEKTSLIARTQTAINQKNEQLAVKQESLTVVSANITTVQTEVNALEAQMKVRKFINANEKQIGDIAYEKNPATIQARADVNSADEVIKTQLAIAQKAEQEALKAGNDGDTKTANAKKKEAENARKLAEEAQRKAEAAKAKLRETDAVYSKINTINTNMNTINTKVENVNKSADVAQEKVQKTLEARDKSVVYTSYVDGTTGETVVDKTKFDLTQMINPAELALVEKFGLDLSECVVKNGLYYPKYIIAKGAYDGQFHIYQRSDSIDLSKYESNLRYSKGASERATDYFAIDIARIYGNGPSWDICPIYNGYMSKYGDADTPKNGMTEVYYITTENCSGEDLKNAEFGATYKSYSTCSPLSLDLNNDGLKTSETVVSYDIDGDGKVDKINDSADAVLCFDKDGNGISGKDGSECFGNNTDLDGDGKADGYKDGFEALKALAQREGLIDNKKDMTLDSNDIKFLELNFGFAVKVNGYNSEAQSLTSLGISAINLAKTNETTLKDNFDGLGNQLMTQEGATFVQNDEVKEYADIWHRKIDETENPFRKLAVA